MAMGLGDSLLLSSNGSYRVSCYSVILNAVLSNNKCGSQCRSVSRSASCQMIFGGLPSLKSPTVIHGSRKKVPAIRATKSGSVDASKSPSSTVSQGQSHFDLLERMTENSMASQGDDVMTIRDQLSSQVEPEAAEEVVPLANADRDSLAFADLTISQKRNIRRQNYLNKVSERNDAPFFATVAGVILVPPLLILSFAVATGYVDLFP